MENPLFPAHLRAWICGSRRVAALLVPGILTGFVASPTSAATEPQRVEWPTSTLEAALNTAAKILCSDHFITGREVATIARDTLIPMAELEGYPTIATEHRPYTPAIYAAALEAAAVDEREKSVELSAGPYRARARYYGDQGCTMLHPLSHRPYFEAKPVPRVEAADGLFPACGDLLSCRTVLPRGYDRRLLEAAATAALDPAGHGAAFLVMHRRRLVVERYADGFGPDTAFLNWSMGKSIMATLIGRLEQKGRITLDQPAPIPSWRLDEKDPRRAITVRHLLTMSSGLSCDRNAPAWLRRGVRPDHGVIYNLPIDVVQHAIHSPYARPAGTEWAYSNCDIQSLGYMLRDIVSRDGDYSTFPYTELYNRIGMSGMVSELDTYGNFHLTGYDYGRGRDWIRYGLLHLDRGVWNGERLLSEAFVAAARTPGAAWYDQGRLKPAPRGTFGAGHWINTNGRFALPENTFYAAGASGNYAFIVPDEDLVIVILRLTSAKGEAADTNAVLTPLMAGLGIAPAR
ncbi:serine hydrolase [Sphingomonas sp. T9W2]|uniref:serine hydrolase domain-containing protein n=1 Tax=Sphingomonas sp. T9W2 TaxID=3143183 RepID=UPI0031F5A930